MMNAVEPRIYVACLASYNNGRLVGEWIDTAHKDVDDIEDEVQAMLKASPAHDAEEWAIHDTEYLPGIGEYSPFADVVRTTAIIAEHGYDLAKAALDHADDLDQAETYLGECLAGVYNDPEDWVLELVEDQLGAMGNLANYFDAARYLRDLECGDVFTVKMDTGETAIFWNR